MTEQLKNSTDYEKNEEFWNSGRPTVQLSIINSDVIPHALGMQT